MGKVVAEDVSAAVCICSLSATACWLRPLRGCCCCAVCACGVSLAAAAAAAAAGMSAAVTNASCSNALTPSSPSRTAVAARGEEEV